VTKKTNKVRIRKRPEKVSGDTYGVPCSLGEVLVTINADPDDSTKPFEILLQLGHAGSEPHAECEAVARLCSVMLRAGIEADEIIKQLEGIKADKPVVWKNHGIVHSLPDAVAKALRVFTEERSGSKIELPPTNDVCSICHGTNVRVQEGCSTCNDCGHSSCG
jgi:ribonucleoside-diphosphate reductase alpha chain